MTCKFNFDFVPQIKSCTKHTNTRMLDLTHHHAYVTAVTFLDLLMEYLLPDSHSQACMELGEGGSFKALHVSFCFLLPIYNI